MNENKIFPKEAQEFFKKKFLDEKTLKIDCLSINCIQETIRTGIPCNLNNLTEKNTSISKNTDI